MSKITLATVKSFVRKAKNLHIKTKWQFDGMVDCVMPIENSEFTVAQPSERHLENTLNIQGAWFVCGGRDYFSAYEDEKFKGFYIHNCCGSFYLAEPK